MSEPTISRPSMGIIGAASARTAAGLPLRSTMMIALTQEERVAPAPSARSDRELCSYAALGYATLALSVARDGIRVDAVAALDAAAGLLPTVSAANPYLAVHVRLAIARAAMMLGDLRAARSAVSALPDLMPLLPDDGNLRNDADTVMAAVTEQCHGAPVGLRLITPAEARVLNLLPSHSTYREIAASLHVSHNTVKSHAFSIYRKLGVGSRSDAVRLSRRLGLVAA